MARPHPALIDLAAGRPMPRSVPDPDRLVSTAVEHRMHGLLWSAITRGDIAVPLDHERRLATHDLRTRAHHHRLWAALEEVTSRLAERGIEVATFKGVTAEARWYDRIGERPSRDLDLWLSPDQFDRIDEVVEILDPTHPLAGDIGAFARRGYLQSIDLNAAGVDVDVHFDPLKVGLAIEQGRYVWASCVIESRHRVLDPELALIQRCLHVIKDGFAELLPMAELVRLSRIVDRGRFWGFCFDEGFERWVALAMGLTQDDLGVELEPELSPTPMVLALANLGAPRRRRLEGETGLLRGSRLWYWIPLTMPHRRRSGLRWLLDKLTPPRRLAAHRAPLVRGPRWLRWFRSRQLQRQANRT